MVGLGVEDVPKLHEDKNGEQQRKFFRGEIAALMMEIKITHKVISETKLRQRIDMAMHEILDEAKQNGHEKQSHTKNTDAHVLGNDEGRARAEVVPGGDRDRDCARACSCSAGRGGFACAGRASPAT